MKKSHLLLLTIFLTLTFLQISCNDNNAGICTTEFVTITVSIKDENQNPISLDSFVVTNTKDGSVITIPLSSLEFENAQQTGQYPIVSDGGIEKNQEALILFKGFINNQEVISSEYNVAADDCHISLVSGNLELVL